MRRYLFAGNWKMNKIISEAKEFATKIINELKDIKEVEIAIFPPFTALYEVYKVIKDSNIKLGAQNLWHEDKGAYTGEISPSFIVDVGCKYVIIGHSERRKYISEDDELVNRKIKAAIKWKLTPIVCIGESLEEREKGDTYKVIEQEFTHGVKRLTGEEFSQTIIAYEPIWAIGTGRTATPETAEEAHKFIRKLIQNKYSEEVAANYQILYGGSVTPDNIEGLISEENIDGALVGGASLDIDSFTQIVKRSLYKDV